MVGDVILRQKLLMPLCQLFGWCYDGGEVLFCQESDLLESCFG